MGQKVCILVDCLSKGGAEKMASNLSFLLVKEGYDVQIVSLRNDISYKFSGSLVNLGLNEFRQKQVKQFQKILKLRRVINSYQPKVIIDFRIRNRWLTEYLLFQLILKRFNVIYTIHSSNLKLHIPRGAFFKGVYGRAKIVCVSKKIKTDIKRDYLFNDVAYIPNAIELDQIRRISGSDTTDEKFIVAVGSLNNEIKQFDKLILEYSQSHLMNSNCKLFILGEGNDRHKLESLIADLHLKDYVKLLGFKENPFSYLKQAQFLVLCSKYEGLPMVILEALALKTPVVSFNCNSGPNEMIVHRENGLLVTDQNFKELKEAMNYLIGNTLMLQKMSNNTLKYLDPYLMKYHFNHWKPIIDEYN